MKKRWSALLSAVVLVLTLTTTAFAAEVPTVGAGTETQEASVSVTNQLVLAEGIAVPDATFHFEATSKTQDAPAATIADITYSAADVPTSDAGVCKVEKTSPIVFAAFPHAGVYEYTVKETAGSDPHMTYSAEEYLLRVYVANKADGVYVQNITAEKDGTKQAAVAFTNTYRKDAALVIEKKTTGSLADKTMDFDFTIQFTKSATADATEFVGVLDGKKMTFPVGQPVSFRLHDGQSLEFKSLPAGTRYVVTEAGAEDGYTPTVTVIENGTKLQEKTGTDKDALNSAAVNQKDNLVGEGENRVTFVNAYQEVPITGVILDNLPFVLLIGATVCALAVLVVFKRRKMSAER